MKKNGLPLDSRISTFPLGEKQKYDQKQQIGDKALR